jgi:multidrug efflux pump
VNISEPFIRRPVGTTLLAIGLMLLGIVAYRFLPVASLPTVELPTITVNAGRPGADPETMASTVAAPLERRLGKIAGVTDISSVSSLGSTSIWIQFDLSRSIDGAARDVQAALNAAAVDLPSDMPNLPTFRKANPNSAPILILALTSRTLTPSALYDIADTTIAQRLSQVAGVAEVTVSGAEQPAVRVRVDPARLASMGTSLDAVRTTVADANALGPVGAIEGPGQAWTLSTNDQIRRPPSFANLGVKTVDGTTLRLSNVAEIEEGVRNNRSAAWYNGQPAVLLNITKSGDANVIETVAAIRALLPDLKRWIPPSVETAVLTDRTVTIRASVEDMELTLVVTIVLVMLVVFLFLRRPASTIAAGVTVPLSLSGTLAAMWAVGYSIDNLSLMAIAIAVGFVVDDAIVMIENIERGIAEGLSPVRAALEGASQIGFTVIAISLSLVAAFIPLLLMGGVQGRYFREFSMTLAFAVIISTLVSLTLTPMICAHFIKPHADRPPNLLDRIVEGAVGGLLRVYARTLEPALRHRYLMLLVLLGTVGATVWLYVVTPKGFFPQDDTGLVGGWVEASTDISFPAMSELQQRVAAVAAKDPAVANVGSSIGGGGWGAAVNNGRLFISLKPLSERGLVTARVIDRLRKSFQEIPGVSVWLSPMQDVRFGGRSGRSPYQFTLWGEDFDLLAKYARLAVERLKQEPDLVDANTDQPSAGLQATVVVDRDEAARLGVRMQDVSTALNNAFAQRQISTLYSRRNQYRIVLEVEPRYRRDPKDLTAIYVSGAGGRQVPLSAIATVERTQAPLSMSHQGQFPSVTVTYNVVAGTPMDTALTAVRRAVAELHLPDAVRADFAGDMKAFRQTADNQPLLILLALLTVYIVLGVLYESLVHPLTILSTLPAAGLGALLSLQATKTDLSIIAFIGIILLIGIVKKNGIMLVDFALEADRRKGSTPEEAALEACLVRFRPILMTTLAAMLGALPLVIATGPGAELRRPLGLTIVGGLVVSQVLTLYTTPVVYVLMDRARNWVARRRGRRATQVAPAE